MRTVSASLATRLAVLSAATLGLAAACATEATSKLPSSSASVQALIGDAACSSDSQCATIGVGAKACGGPDAYVAWSSARTDPQVLRAAVQRHADAARSEQAAKGMVSACIMASDPGAFCDLNAAASGPTGTCRLRKTSGGTGPLVR
ncbi:MAG TPA: hypothetical protein VKI18_03925 [Albitalea sp.]|nr:hypothetical protein [Albitalea sp.]